MGDVRKLREIERLRGIAALMVVTTHFGNPIWDPGPIFNHPRTGVDLFFVISGLVVTRSLMRLMPDVSTAGSLEAAFAQCRSAFRVFYVRRFFRIVPMAIAAIALQRLLFALGATRDITGGSLDDYWREVYCVFTGFYNYAQPAAGWGQLGVFWSLSVEEHFYLLLPLALLLFRTRGRRIAFALGGIAFVALVCRTFLDTPPAGTANPDFYRLFSSHLRFDALLAGVALALIFDGEPAAPIMPRPFIRWIVVPASLVLVMGIPRFYPGTPYFHQGFTATWFLCGVIVAYASLDRGYVLQIPVLGRVLEHVGARSYALYLLHFPVHRFSQLIELYEPAYKRFGEHFPRTDLAVQYAAMFAAVELSWWLLELPMQKLGRRLTDPTPSASPSMPAALRNPAIAAVAGTGVAMVIAPLFHEFATRHGHANLALHRRVTGSSATPEQPDLQQLTNGVLESEAGAHTQNEKDPWLAIDLGRVTQIGAFVTYNCIDGFENEVVPLTIEISNDGERYRALGRRMALFSQWLPWRFEVDGVAARYVRYHGPEGRHVCLSEAQVLPP